MPIHDSSTKNKDAPRCIGCIQALNKLDRFGQTQGVAFDDAGERLAYVWCRDRDSEVVLCDVTDGWKELRRFQVRDWGWAHLQFSPGKEGRVAARLAPRRRHRLPRPGDRRGAGVEQVLRGAGAAGRQAWMG